MKGLLPAIFRGADVSLWRNSQARIDTALAERNAGVSAQFRRDFLPLYHISYFIRRRSKTLTNKKKSEGLTSSGTGFVAKFDF